MTNNKNLAVKNGDHCVVVHGTHTGKSGVVQDLHESKTGHLTITVVQDNRVRFKTLAKNVTVQAAHQSGSSNTKTARQPAKKSKLVAIKTKPTAMSVDDFIGQIADEEKRKDCYRLIDMMKKASGEEPVLWSNAIIGFGNKRYTSPNTGREVDWLLIGFSPRKANLSLYISVGIEEHAAALQKLGKHKTGVGCLYINKLADVDLQVLQGMINASVNRKK
jgi:ribosomal protein L24